MTTDRDAVRGWMLPGFDDTISDRQQAFEWFHQQHPEVYTELLRRAHLMRSHGLRFGLRTLYEAMRWDFAMADPPMPYKLNNNHAPFYSRLLMEREPTLDGIFEIRGGD